MINSETPIEAKLQARETKAKKLIARRESTQFTYSYTENGQKVRTCSLISE